MYVIGADEVGRGALAGPVVVGSVGICRDFYERYKTAAWVPMVQDSKMLTAERREEIFDYLQELLQTGILTFACGEASVNEIESYNILKATTLAFQRALENLKTPVPLSLEEKNSLFSRCVLKEDIQVLIDGLALKQFPYQHKGVVKGDRTSFCIAAASIVAKVTRDRYMSSIAKIYPQYAFDENKGYGTEKHRQAIRKYGPCSLHRPSFLKKMNLNDSNTFQLSFL